MNNSDILFKNLKEISSATQKGNDKVLIDYLNTFKGDNIYEKFKNILSVWGIDVSYTLNINLGDKSTKIQLDYIVSEMPENLGKEVIIEVDNVKLVLDIPKTFDTLSIDIIPIYSIIQDIYYNNIKLIINSVHEKSLIIDNLPARIYTEVLHSIINNKENILTFSNPVLERFKFNFLTNEPFLFLKGLFNNFDELYFRDIIFHLSKRIDGNILLGSTPMEIEYYIEKLSEEMKNQNESLTSK